MKIMIEQVAAIPVVLAGMFMMGLAGVAVFAPEKGKRFLLGFASTKKVHLLELAVRLVVGIAMIASAPRMQFTPIFTTFGWVLVITTVGMGLLPWTMHKRFAEWAVPMATKTMGLIGAGSLMGGLLILWWVFGG